MANREQYIIVGASSVDGSSPEMLVPVSGAVLSIEGMTSGNVLLEQYLSGGWTTIAIYTTDRVIKVDIAPGNLIRVSWDTVVGTPTVSVLPASDNGFATAATDIITIEDDIGTLETYPARVVQLTADRAITYAGAGNYSDIFASSLTLESGTAYMFEIWMRATQGATAVAKTLKLNGGTATFTRTTFASSARASALNTIAAPSAQASETSTGVNILAAGSAVDIQFQAVGMLVVDAAGTFMPQFGYSTDPGPSIVFKAGSYMSLSKVSSYNA